MRRNVRFRTSALLIVAVATLSACTVNFPQDEPESPLPRASTGQPAEPTPTPTAVSADALAKAVVQVVHLDEDGEPGCSFGSGTILDPHGTVLTNFHVVEYEPDCTGKHLGIAVTSSTDQPPELLYLADVVAVDSILDLAVLRIVSTTDGDPVDASFPFVAMGDSDSVELSDALKILGYPAIGGNTITYTEGEVSGFRTDAGTEGRAWIKTDGTIAGGNSGGLAADADGRIVAIPTLASANGGQGDPTDCRILQDTNGDGSVDDDDSCIPIGGFLNSLRPVNLAAALIAAAPQADAIPLDELVQGYDASTEQVGTFTSVRFAEDVANDQPVGEGVTLPSGIDQLCAFVTYEGMAAGTPWSAIWTHDAVVDHVGSTSGSEWDLDRSGETWLCNGHPGEPMADGTWGVTFFVGDSTDGVLTGIVAVGDGGSSDVSITFTNATSVAVCFLYVVPSGSTEEPEDRLGHEQILAPGESVGVLLAPARYGVLARDCDYEPVSLLDDELLDRDMSVALE